MIQFGFQFKMKSFLSGSYKISVGEEDSPITEKILNISSSNENSTHEIHHLKPCTEYEHNVTLFDMNGTEILCGGSGGKAKTLDMNEHEITNSPCAPGYVCYQSGWDVSSLLLAPNQVLVEQFGDGTFGFELSEEDFCSNTTISFNQDNCNSFNFTQYISADYINPNKMNQTKHNRLPAEIETKLPPNCKNLSIEYTCSESGKVGDSIQLSDLEPFTDYICSGLIKNTNKRTPPVQFNINCDFTFIPMGRFSQENYWAGWFKASSKNCEAVLPNLKKLSYNCSAQENDGEAKIYVKAVQKSNEIKCETYAAKPFTKYIVETFPIYNNRRVSPGLIFESQTDPGVPGKVQQLSVYLLKRNVIRVTCAEPVGGFKGPKKVYIVRVGDRKVEQMDECDFEIGDLSYLTSYTVEVVAFNGRLESKAETVKVVTAYNDKALSGFLIFILIVLIIVPVALRLAVLVRKWRKSKKVKEVMLTSRAKAY